ncbi:4216_t:CDS:2 [Entrophospora sp. SA101]|nr:4199_t:CDS:2 [Entrophospora sp. SA101]CAJ0913968.1 4209_t:CDS:2 [Entrophospora sp. SA101]CAJ0913982.1 4216_t:CDS:2 [Entrophospora sp. SA101]
MSGSSRKEFIQTYRDSTPGVNTITDWDVRYNDMAQLSLDRTPKTIPIGHHNIRVKYGASILHKR